MTPLAHRQFFPQEARGPAPLQRLRGDRAPRRLRRRPAHAALDDPDPPRQAAAQPAPVSSELDRVALLRRALAQSGSTMGHVLLGIGDDAAVLAAPANPLVWTVDAAVEGVHFRRELLSLGDLGYRATMAAASDLAAMGAAPLGLLAALVLPPWVSDADLEALAKGQREAAIELGTAVTGGNLARGGELSITTTALGAAARPLTRAGARPGDAIWMAGPVGLAAAGLAALERGGATAETAAAVAAWRRPRGSASSRGSGRAGERALGDRRVRRAGARRRAPGPGERCPRDPRRGVPRGPRAPRRRRRAVARSPGSGAARRRGLRAGRGPARRARPSNGFTRVGAAVPDDGGSPVALRREDGTVAPLDARGFDHFGG